MFRSWRYITSTASFSELEASLAKVLYIIAKSAMFTSILCRITDFWPDSIITFMSSSDMVLSRSSKISFLSRDTTSPVSSSTKSSVQVFNTLAASFLPTIFFRFALLVDSSSDRPKMSKMSLSDP